ncbi:MAG: hypothetical protein ACM336_18825 [Acidobacteriota bacterium]
MPAVGASATQKVVSMLGAETGLPFAISTLMQRESVELPVIGAAQVAAQNIAFDAAEKTAGVTYPAVYVYCEGLANQLKEKFRTFSGKAHMVVEVRVSDNGLDNLARDLQLYAAAAAEVLDSHRGAWDDSMFYSGGYKVEFGPVKRGGRNFLQTAKISFDVDVSY